MNAQTNVGMASPSYCAEMRRAHAKRVARAECQRAIEAAYCALGEAEGEADRTYLAEMDRINADMFSAWAEERKAA